MHQRGRRGPIQLAMLPFARPNRPDRPATVRRLTPPPATLAEEEKAIWCSITAQRDFNPVGTALLHNALRMHEIGRVARQNVLERGMMVVDKNGAQRLNPMCRLERDARQLFYQT
jgi:hypothetical protein